MRDSDVLRVKQILVSVLELPIAPEALGFDQALSAPEVGLDSLSLLELVVRLEHEFEILIDDQDVFAAKLRSIADLVALVENRMTARAG